MPPAPTHLRPPRRVPLLIVTVALVGWLFAAFSGALAFAGSANGHGAPGNGSTNGNGTTTAPGQVKKQDPSPPTVTAPAPPVQRPSSGDTTQPQPLSNADQNPGGANNGGDCGAYCSTRDGSPSKNGNGNGKAVGKPCAGCVGKADNKNPKGQRPNGSDHNNGYECDGNHGIGRTNPAHTGCKAAVIPTPTPTPTKKPTPTPTPTPTKKPTPTPTPTPTSPTPTPSSTPTPTPTPSPPTPSPTPSVQASQPTAKHPPVVLGEKVVRTPPPASSLPFTGADAIAMLAIAVLAVACGSWLLLADLTVADGYSRRHVRHRRLRR